jgi:hypothetical protein
MERLCMTCAFFDDTDPTSPLAGECRAHPPMPVTENVDGEDRIVSYWPDVDYGDWCGEWKAKVNADPAETPDAEQEASGE